MARMETVLIANRGEIACRIIRGVQALGKKTVVVYHPDDASSLAVRLADAAEPIDGPSPVAAYLSMDAILEACRRSGAQAVHPGFGFLAENAEFARRVEEAGLIFIGPDAKAIAAMGNKIHAKQLAQKAGVTTIPGVDGEIADAGQAVEMARALGFPVMIKASAGGGGKGMRVVHGEDTCREAFVRTQGEARAAFGDDRVFMEKFIQRPRHIEIQVLADAHGNVVHLGERECSIQRRHQKLIEEAPSPFLDEATRQAMGAQAVALAKAVGYRSAGTVEFLVDAQRRFYFLEMNTRIQVEHPVTEMTTGVDIVAEQIRIAEGEALGYLQDDIRFNGHAIECRLCAEDPEAGFIPATGTLYRFRVPQGEGVRLDTGVREGDRVTTAFDSMLAKLIVHRRTRAEALQGMDEVLRETVALGVTTNAAFLHRVLRHADFAAGEVHTDFLAEQAETLASPPLTSGEAAVVLAAALLSNRILADERVAVPALHGAMGSWKN